MFRQIVSVINLQMYLHKYAAERARHCIAPHAHGSAHVCTQSEKSECINDYNCATLWFLKAEREREKPIYFIVNLVEFVRRCICYHSKSDW